MTTKRVRNHELEELSLAALRFELPPKWVIHDYRKDYGIDVQLEIFEADGLATGLRCYGQLKATDNSAIDDVLALDRDHFEYWSAHADPVLLLRYYADTQQYAWCWLHDVAWSLKAGAESLSVAKFLKPWDRANSPRAIQNFLKQRNQIFIDRQLPPFCVAVRGDSIPFARLLDVTNVLDEIEGLSSLRFETESLNSVAFDILLLPDGIACSYLGLPGLKVEEFDSSTPAYIANTIILLIFFTACRYDKILVARPLAKNCFNLLIKAAGEKLLFPLIDSVVYAIGLKDAINLFHEKRASATTQLGDSLFFGVLYVASQRYGDSDEYISLLHESLASSSEAGHRAATAYNLGNALSNKGYWSEALPMFKLAAEASPEYYNRTYFRHEYGAAFFENGFFLEAAEQYRAALLMDPSAKLHSLLGDVLFSAGCFSEGLKELDIALESTLGGESAAITLLLRGLCCEWVEEWGVNKLNHVPFEGDEIDIFRDLFHDESEDFRKSILPWIQKFGSDALFNFNAGCLALQNNQYIFAFYRFLNCAARQRGDSEAWAFAVASAMKAGDSDLMALAIISGYFFVKEKLIVDFFRVTSYSNANLAEREKLQKIFTDIVHASQSTDQSKSVTVRFLGQEKIHTFNSL